MPAQVELVDSSASSKQFVAQDSAGIYYVMAWNVMTFDGLHDSHRRKMYAELMRQPVDSTHRTLYSHAEVLIANYQGVAFVIKETQAGTSQTYLVYARCVISEQKGYLLYFAPVDKGKHTGMQGNPFFNSFTLR